MDTYVLSSFVKQLEKSGYSKESLIVNYKNGMLKMDSLKVTVIDPLTRYKMCSFCFPAPKPESAQAAETLVALKSVPTEEILAAPKAEVKPNLPDLSKYNDLSLFPWSARKKRDYRIWRTKVALLTFNVRIQDKGAADGKVVFRLKNAYHEEPEISISQLPPLYVLTNASRAAEQWDRSYNTDNKVTCFSRACYVAAACLLVLCVISTTGWHVFNDQEIYFIGAAVMLAILPHTKVIKMFGMEIERDDETAGENGTAQVALAGAAALLSMSKQAEAKAKEASSVASDAASATK